MVPIDRLNLKADKYSIMYRVFKDETFYGYFTSGQKAQWSVWYNYRPGGFPTLKAVREQYDFLLKNAELCKNKREYKVVKNEWEV